MVCKTLQYIYRIPLHKFLLAFFISFSPFDFFSVTLSFSFVFVETKSYSYIMQIETFTMPFDIQLIYENHTLSIF